MPGPKMGPRPIDFNEELVRKAPTFQKWLKLDPGQYLTYACRKFLKGGIDDEERLMRRIMIARRNNIKDHAVLKRARAAEAEKRGTLPEQGLETKAKGDTSPAKQQAADPLQDCVANNDNNDSEMDNLPESPERPMSPSNPSGTKRRRVKGMLQMSDEEILMEMDVPAVEATRSYRRWLTLPDGSSFTYNQNYFKGKDDHDWLLKKNIWRRMRYRRENQMKVVQMNMEQQHQQEGEAGTQQHLEQGMVRMERGESNDWTADWKVLPPDDAAAVVDAANVPGLPKEDHDEDALVSQAVHDAAAVAAAQVQAFEPGIDADAVAALGADDPIVSSALDAAAQLAAAAVADAVADAPVDDGLEENTGVENGVDGVEGLVSV